MGAPVHFLNWRRMISLLVTVCFTVTGFNVPLVQAQDFRLPAPGVMVHLSPPLNPPMLKGIKVHPDNPFRFDFILDQGDSNPVIPAKAGIQNQEQLKIESTKLIKYFLASLTIPEKDLWVNLSPYEKDRIIPQSFGLTEMGRDLLAEDYMLKQITASLIYPEDEIGKKFWKRIYEEASKRFGTTNIPVNTFNKVWIVPEKAVVYENAKAGTAYVVEAKLKVMLEQDYLSLEKHSVILSERRSAAHLKTPLDSSATPQNDVSTLGSQIVREIVIPELTKEVNEGKNFAKLRQVYNSLILATWYKKKIKDSILEQVYENKNKVVGVNIDDPKEKERIYGRYLQAFKKGVFNYIKEDTDTLSQETIPRKYFSGGVALEKLNITPLVTSAGVMPNINDTNGTYVVGTFVDPGIGETTKIDNADQNLPSTSMAHDRNAQRLNRILRLIARFAHLSATGSNSEIIEFLVEQLRQKGLVDEDVDQDGNVILKISQHAQEDRIGKAIYKWVMNPQEGFGAKSVNFQSSQEGPWNGQWLIVGLEEELNNVRLLKHEQREVFYRKQNPTWGWIEAHNAAVRELKDGVLINPADVNQTGNQTDIGTGLFNWRKKDNKNKEVVDDSVKQEVVIEPERIESVPKAQGVKIIDTDMTLDYGGLEKWDERRILIDFVQNHKPADAKGSKTEVTFHLKNGRTIGLLDPEVQSLRPEDVDSIEIADDGIGYDVEHLKYFLTTKGSTEESGKFGEGLKIATAAAMKRGIQVEFQSRSWQAKPIIAEKILNKGFQNEIATYNIALQVSDTQGMSGSRTIIRSPSSEFLNQAKRLPDLVLFLNQEYRPTLVTGNVGEVVGKRSGEKSEIYVKGNYVISLPDGNIAYRPALFNYNLFNDSDLNRDRDNLPRSAIEAVVKLAMFENITPEIAKHFIQKSIMKEEDGKFKVSEEFYENGLYFDYYRKLDERAANVWRQAFQGLYGEDAILGETTGYSGKPDALTEQAIKEGKKVVLISGLVGILLVKAGVATTTSIYYEKENQNVSTGLTLNYRETAWGIDRILLDAVQNHLPKDAGSTKINVEFSLKGEEESRWLDINEISQFHDDRIASVRIRDNGTGYDYKLLGLLFSTKNETPEAAGGWGEGLKMLSAACLRAGLGLELRSRNWKAKAKIETQFYNDADGKSVQVQVLSYDMVHLRKQLIEGSETIFTQPTSDFLKSVRRLAEKALILNPNYHPLSTTEGGEIVSTTSDRLYVQGLEVQDTARSHHNILSYNFINIPGIIVSPDRNVLHAGKVTEAIGLMLAQTDSVEAVTAVINAALKVNGSRPEYQDVTRIPSYKNRQTWQNAWESVVSQKGWDPKKVVLGTQRTIHDPDTQLLLRNMGYQVVFMNYNIALVIHSLGVHLDSEVLEPDFQYMNIDDLTPAEIKILQLRQIIDKKLEEILGKKIEPSPMEVFTSVKSKLTGDALEGYQAYWNTATKKIGMKRSQLADPESFGRSYMEEMGHRLSEAGDYTREFTNFFRNALVAEIFKQQGIVVEGKPITDDAMVTKNIQRKVEYKTREGGIDLTPSNMNLQTQNNGGEIEFHLDPAMLAQLQNAPGFVPVIISIQPMTDLKNFLGL